MAGDPSEANTGHGGGLVESGVYRARPDDNSFSREVAPDWRHLVRDRLQQIGTNCATATEAANRSDWGRVLEAVRLIHGGSALTRKMLECTLGRDQGAADRPWPVRSVQAVKRLISEREIDSLPQDHLRDRMRAVLRALDGELRAFLRLPDEPPIP
jgi:hypothetical protein